MSSEDIVRAWKDPDRRGDAGSVDHPAGEISFDVVGGSVGVASTEYALTLGCCGGITSGTCTCTWGPGCGYTHYCTALGAC